MTVAVETRPGTQAKVRYVRTSASKVRAVLGLIRGKSVSEALQVLTFTERLASVPVEKCLRSAIANAEHNDDIDQGELFVSACYADEGPSLRRFKPRARGRAGRINKQTCHLTIVVSRYGDDELDELRDREEAAGRSKPKDESSNRRRRVAKSRQADGVGGEAVETDEPAPQDTPEDSVEETESEAFSGTVDSDSDGESNVDDKSPYGAGSHALIDDDPDQIPEGFPIKGNAQSKLYHNENSSFYSRTKAEVWFATDSDAEAAGFVKPESQRKKEEAAAEANDEPGASGTEDSSEEGEEA